MTRRKPEFDADALPEKTNLLRRFRFYPTNSIEYLIKESEKRRQKLTDETVQQRAERLKEMKNYWELNADRYNANRRKRRAEAKEKLLKSQPALVRPVGRPPVAPAVTHPDFGIVQQQAKVRSGYDDFVTQHVTEAEIKIPKELGSVFNDNSDDPMIVLDPDSSKWPMYHIRPFAKLKPNTRNSYLTNFVTAMKAAGYSPPANPERDPLVYANWYANTPSIDAFHVVKENSEEYGTFGKGKNDGQALSTGAVNARASALLNIVVQGILECILHKSFHKDTCKRLLRDHFIYFDFQHRAKRRTGQKFNKQIETSKDKENTIPWDEWMAMAKTFIGKVFFLTGDKEGQLKKQPKSQHDYAEIRDAVIVSVFSLLPITRLTPWDSTVVKPAGYEKGGAGAKDYMEINYVTPEGRAFFNNFKNYSSVYTLADPPKNSPFEQPINSELFRKILKTWISVKPAGNPFLFPANFKEGEKKAVDLGNKLRMLAKEIDSEHRGFGNRLMRRAYIKWVRTGNHGFDKNDVHALIKFMLSVHQTSPLVNMGYVKTSTPENAIKQSNVSSQAIFDSVLSAIEGEQEEGAAAEPAAAAAAAGAVAAPKRRGRPPKKKVVEESEEEEMSSSESDSDSDEEAPPPPPRARSGRAKKAVKYTESSDEEGEEDEPPAIRGRAPKAPPAVRGGRGRGRGRAKK